VERGNSDRSLATREPALEYGPLKRWDVFICHASVDKEGFVLPLAEALRARGISVWLDRWEIDLGHSVSGSISEGLTRSRFGIVVLSRAFFSRPWPQKELGALFAQETDGASHIIPIWHDIELADLLANAPLLADRMAARSADGVSAIVERVTRLLRRDRLEHPAITPQALRALTERLFPNLPVDEFWQTHLLADLDALLYRSILDIECAYKRARHAVEAFAVEEPRLFRSGTDYLTKSLGFVDPCFRSRHSWAEVTKRAFVRYAEKIDWDAEA